MSTVLWISTQQEKLKCCQIVR